jgi:uncharacterized protein (DUF486 family)
MQRWVAAQSFPPPRCRTGIPRPHDVDDSEECMTIALYITAAIIMATTSFYFALRNRDVRKFLAGAFFVSSGILFYLYLADVSVPLLGTSFVETPQISGGRSIVHLVLFLLCFYFGFVSKPKV